ncbi:DNA mismatch repair endonuclease MutL [Buchnera aphidicola]|uniref:DNA mismatch repair protein MutL n=1 Tax=Buchnera aphidicola (Aphis nerii) TaxID=1241835 RepID=A0A4D6XX41_9GAMM|nr:DNA mismatch repair endonuclease MutL [Buchnera aphidicola]QCI19078.1 DNA mismatch repair endonuclease MutL [Buchnera aphidicola (Aphis nerii)]
MPIRILPISVSSQITAGEIIERPSSVIKELLENSIDAESKNININIEQNGFESIIIKDDGYGIDRNELLLAISPHATSKIFDVSDLSIINTFGFRGEALSSIRSVSKITLMSCFKDNHIGWKIYADGSNKKTTLFPIAHPVGTTVIVDHLFYNVPVRLKFIKDKNSEFLKIYDVIKKIALSHFELNIFFKKNKNVIVTYNKITNSENKIFRLKQIFNQLDINALLMVNKKINNVTLFGWVVYPSYFIDSFKNIQYCYINNRFVYNNIISNAVLNAYYEFTGVKTNRSFILYINIPPYEIDINIHPSKSQVRFHKSNKIYDFVYNSILNILKRNQNQLFLYNIPSKKKEKHYITDFYTFCFKLIKKKILQQQKEFLFQNIIKNNFFLEQKSKNQILSSLKLLIIIKKYYGLIHYINEFILISFPLAEKIVNQYKLKFCIKNSINPTSYIFEMKIVITSKQYKVLFKNQLMIFKFGFDFILLKKYINLKKIPCILKEKNIDLLILNFFTFASSENELNIKKILEWFYNNISTKKKPWNYLDGILLLLELEYFCPFILKKPDFKLSCKINIDEALCILKI